MQFIYLIDSGVIFCYVVLILLTLPWLWCYWMFEWNAMLNIIGYNFWDFLLCCITNQFMCKYIINYNILIFRFTSQFYAPSHTVKTFVMLINTLRKEEWSKPKSLNKKVIYTLENKVTCNHYKSVFTFDINNVLEWGKVAWFPAKSYVNSLHTDQFSPCD